MISMGSARRRAEEFASLVDAGAGERPADATQSSYADLIAVVSQMRAVPAPEPRPEFVMDLRERLMLEADTALVATDGRLEITRPEVRRRDRRVAAVVGVAALLGAGTSVAVASQAALPGDALYPIKRALESAETSFEAGDQARGASMSQRAATRLAELEQLVRDGGEPAAMAGSLSDFVVQSKQAADLTLGAYETSRDPALVLELRDFAAGSLQTLAGLQPQLPSEVRPLLDTAVTALLGIDARALEACPSCGGPVDLPLSLVAAGVGSDHTRPVRPALAPPVTLQQDDTTSSDSTSSDPVRALLGGLPSLGTVIPEVSPEQTNGGSKPGSGSTGGSGPGSGSGILKPVEKLTDPLLGENGLVGGSTALDGLLGGLLGEGTLLDDTLGTGKLLN